MLTAFPLSAGSEARRNAPGDALPSAVTAWYGDPANTECRLRPRFMVASTRLQLIGNVKFDTENMTG